MLGYDSADCWSLAADFNGQNTKWNRIADMPYHRYVRSLKMDGKIPHWIYTTLEFKRKYSTDFGNPKYDLQLQCKQLVRFRYGMVH